MERDADLKGSLAFGPFVTHTGHGPVDCPIRLVSLYFGFRPAFFADWLDNTAMPIRSRSRRAERLHSRVLTVSTHHGVPDRKLASSIVYKRRSH